MITHLKPDILECEVKPGFTEAIFQGHPQVESCPLLLTAQASQHSGGTDCLVMPYKGVKEKRRDT